MAKHSATDDDANMQGSLDALTRRGFMRLNATLIAASSTTSCSWGTQHEDVREALQLLRAQDLLSLRVALSNIHVQHRYLKPTQLVRTKPGKPATLTFILPGQHIAEAAFVNGDPTALAQLPSSAFIAGPTRLVFQWDDTQDAVELSFSTLLDWAQWRFIPEQSTIEIPAGIALSTYSPLRFEHATTPVVHNARAELWHTRIASADPDATHPSVTIALAPVPPDTQFRLTPSLQNRRSTQGKQAQLRTLLLSAQGGWLDLFGNWEQGPVRRWEHRSAAGRDQRVVVERETGFVYPFGHQAAVIEVTERVVDDARALSGTITQAALLRRRRFIVIKQASVTYAAGNGVFQQITLQQKTTPPLSGYANTADDPYLKPFWIESGDQAFEFDAQCRDWAGHTVFMSLNAVFVADDPQRVEEAHVFYAESDSARRTGQLNGQSTVVAPFDTPRARKTAPSEGDTTLQLLSLRHTAETAPETGRLFDWRTQKMRVRIPALANDLPADVNDGWFSYVNPDPADEAENSGELFAYAEQDDVLIPMSFADKTDRSGGLVTPSINVQGISRRYGPVGDADSVRDGSDTSLGKYFSDDAAILFNIGFGSLSLDFKPTWAPQFYVKVEKAEDEEDKDKDPSAENDETASDKTPKKDKKAVVKTGLNWDFDFGKLDVDAILIGIKSQVDDDDKPLCRLKLNTELAKTFVVIKGDNANTEQADSQPSQPADAATAQDAAKKETETDSTTSWSASATLTHFDLRLGADALGTMTIGFSKLGVILGPPKPEKDDEDTSSDDTDAGGDEPETADDTEESGEQKKKRRVDYKIDYGLNGLSGTGLLGGFAEFLELVRTLQDKFKYATSYNNGGPPAPYPPSIPDVSAADISINRGPIKMPDINFGIFSISDVQVSFGLGFYLVPRTSETGQSRLPGSLMTFAIGSAEQPLTALSPPWGGIAHLAASIDFDRGLTGFQFGFGIAAGAVFEFGIGKGRCLSSLSATYTFINTAEQSDYHSFTVALRLDGKAVIAGWIEISLRLAAIANVDETGWTFAATLDAHVKIAFFVVSVQLQFSHFVAIGGPDKMRVGDNTGATMNREQWHRYHAAFAPSTAP